jgi:Tfp pilus assembly protein PilO
MTDVRRVISENRRAVWVLTAALVANAGLYALVVYPLTERVQAEQQQAGDATQRLVAARRTFEAARGTVTGKQQADEELRRFYQEVLPADLKGARQTLFPHVDQLARKANLADVRSRFEAPNEGEKGPLRKLTITLSFSGEYTNVRQFIHELETAPEFLVLESVQVTQAEEGEGDLNVTARVATYYRGGGNGS